MVRLKLIAALMIAIITVAATGVTVAAPPQPWPTSSWATSTPEEQGMKSAELATFIQTFTQPQFNTNSILVIRHGYLIAEVNASPDQSANLRDIKSASKSIVGTLVGIALDRGEIKSLDATVLSFFPDYKPANMDERKAAMTVKDLLTMGSGFKCSMYDADPTSDAIAVTAKDTAHQCLDKPMAFQPGEKMQYCQCNTYLLAAILARQTGVDVLAYAKEHLFTPLGITNIGWLTTGENVVRGFTGLQIKPVDMAKIGYLYLNKGQWDGKQIVSADFVAKATSTQIATDWPDSGYGYQWWVIQSINTAAALGRGGQYIVINPTKDIVVVLTGEFPESLRAYLQGYPMMYAVAKLTAADAALPSDPDGIKNLTAAIEGIAKPVVQTVAELPKMASTVTGKTYGMLAPIVVKLPLSDAPISFKALSFDFSAADHAQLTLVPVSGDPKSIEVGLDGLYRVSDYWGGRVAAKGAWLNANEFRMQFKMLGDVLLQKFNVTFLPGGITVQTLDYVGGASAFNTGVVSKN